MGDLRILFNQGSNKLIFTQVEVNIENLSNTQYTGWLNSRIPMGNFLIPVKPYIHPVFDEFMVKKNNLQQIQKGWIVERKGLMSQVRSLKLTANAAWK